MTCQELNTALYEKMFAEQEEYRKHLLTLPPEEILQHTYEYTMREDLLLNVESNDLPPSHAKALLRSPTPLADAYRAWDKRDCTYMDDMWDCICVLAQERGEQQKAQRQQER